MFIKIFNLIKQDKLGQESRKHLDPREKEKPNYEKRL